MTARCFNDSCSIHWSEVNGGSSLIYQGDVQLEPSLQCGGVQGAIAAGTGVGVNLSEDAGNTLALHGNGLYAGVPNAVFAQKLDAPLRAIGNSTDIGAPSASSLSGLQVTNTTGRAGIAIIKGQFEIAYSIHKTGLNNTDPDIGDLTPYGAQIRAQFKINGTPVIASRVDIGGLTNVPTTGPSVNVQYKSTDRPFEWIMPIAAGQVLTFDDAGFHDGPDQRVNLTIGDPTEDGPRGFRTQYFQVAILPIGT